MIEKIKYFIEKFGLVNLSIAVLGIIVIISGLVIFLQRRGVITSNRLEFSTNAFEDNGPIDKYYTCDGDNTSPEFTINAVPTKARTLSIIIEDLDLDQKEYRNRPYTANLMVWNIPATTLKFVEGERPPGTIGKSIKETYNYAAPCPPTGQKHNFKVTIYATDKDSLPIGTDSGLSEAKKIIENNAIAESSKTFSYAR